MSELEDLRAEVKHWKDHAEEAGRGFAQICRENNRSMAERRAWRERAKAAEAKVAAVEALVDEHWLDPVNFKEPVAAVVRAVQTRLRAALASAGRTEPSPEWCHGDRDGECHWASCPQLRDGEPVASGRHCPLDVTPDEAGA